MTSNMRLMKASEIPAFVDKVIEAGCDICAIDHLGYSLGDVDGKVPWRKAKRIVEEFGDRDHLLPEIVAYLRSIGRYIELSSSTNEGRRPHKTGTRSWNE
ncbi:hypothetical protein [Mesorhizobium sp. M0578]|uniref:hypothetical protein n=1 Tax=unclassified Mesorhizobium TaxID=325217 RepID=UPI003336E9A1